MRECSRGWIGLAGVEVVLENNTQLTQCRCSSSVEMVLQTMQHSQARVCECVCCTRSGADLSNGSVSVNATETLCHRVWEIDTLSATNHELAVFCVIFSFFFFFLSRNGSNLRFCSCLA